MSTLRRFATLVITLFVMVSAVSVRAAAAPGDAATGSVIVRYSRATGAFLVVGRGENFEDVLAAQNTDSEYHAIFFEKATGMSRRAIVKPIGVAYSKVNKDAIYLVIPFSPSWSTDSMQVVGIPASSDRREKASIPAFTVTTSAFGPTTALEPDPDYSINCFRIGQQRDLCYDCIYVVTELCGRPYICDRATGAGCRY